MSILKALLGHLGQKETILHVLNVLAGAGLINVAPDFATQISLAIAAVAVVIGRSIDGTK